MFRKLIMNFFADPVDADAETVRKIHNMRIAAFAGMGIAFIIVTMMWKSSPKAPEAPKTQKEAKKVDLASMSLDVKDGILKKLEDKADTHLDKIQELVMANEVLQKRMDEYEALHLDSLKQGQTTEPSYNGPQGEIDYTEGYSSPLLSGIPTQTPGKVYEGGQAQPFKAEKPKMSFVSLEGSGVHSTHADNYVLKGTYAQAVLLSGLAVSTAVSSQSNPQPLKIKLLDSGNLPRGWKSKLKDAELIGSCYGDLSSERAMCRINSISFTESDGTGVEIKVEGWVFGEDGAPGIRGKVVDRAGEVARESLLAGILGGMANFLQAKANNSIYPVSPIYGQVNSMSGEEMLKGAAGSGASNALDKLAEFSIKRAESMQPVIMVNGGRRVDVLFKEGFSLKPNVGQAIKVKGTHE